MILVNPGPKVFSDNAELSHSHSDLFSHHWKVARQPNETSDHQTRRGPEQAFVSLPLLRKSNLVINTV